MQRQQGGAHHGRSRRVAVVTDSAADLPEEVMDRLDIHMIPVRVHFGEHSYLDKISMSPEQFYRELATNPEHPKTSQPPPGDFRRAFEFLASHYESVVYVGLTSQASGTLQSGQSAAQRTTAAGRITVVDSQNASLGQGLIAMRAAELAAAGLGAEEIVRDALEIRGRTRDVRAARHDRLRRAWRPRARVGRQGCPPAARESAAGHTSLTAGSASPAR